MRTGALLLLGSCVALGAPGLSARADSSVAPGLMGFNALPALPNVDPVVGTRTELELAAASQLSGFAARDAALTPYFRLSVPFAGVAAVDFDGTPFELWRVTPATQARIRSRDASGAGPGDVRFGGRFLLSGETDRWPALGMRFSVKSTTGKQLKSRRFTNSPAYLIDAIAAKDVYSGAGVLRGVRVLAKLGFVAWQLGVGEQNDAVDYGLTARASLPWFSLAGELRGYRGFIHRDRPSLAGLTLARALGRKVELVSTMNFGLSRDAPPLEVRAGIVTSFELALSGERKRRDPAPRPGAEVPPGAEPAPAPGEAPPPAEDAPTVVVGPGD